MTLLLKYVAQGVDADLQQIPSGELALLRYYLRVAFANHLNVGGSNAGSIQVNESATEFGRAVDTAREVATGSDPVDFVTPARRFNPVVGGTYRYGQHFNSGNTFANIAFDNSYVTWNGNDLMLESNQDNIVANIITDCIEEMKNGDQVGTYRVAMTSPGAGWVDKGIWFTDTVFDGLVATVEYRFWLRTSAPPPAGNSIPIVLSAANELKMAVLSASSPLVSFLFNVLLSRLNLPGNSLRYSLGDTGTSKGSFTDTRLDDEEEAEVEINENNYFTTATPSGMSATATTYTLRLT